MLRTWCSPTHPVFFAPSYFCNNVVFGALLGWARRNLRFTHKLARLTRYHLAREKCGDCIGFVHQGSASDEKPRPLAGTAAVRPQGHARFTHSLSTQPAGRADVSVSPPRSKPRGCRHVQRSILIDLSQYVLSIIKHQEHHHGVCRVIYVPSPSCYFKNIHLDGKCYYICRPTHEIKTTVICLPAPSPEIK